MLIGAFQLNIPFFYNKFFLFSQSKHKKRIRIESARVVDLHFRQK